MFKINETIINNLAAKINAKEIKANKTTSLSSSSTDTQYPSAKAVYDALAEVIAEGGGAYIDDYYFDSATKEFVLKYTNSGGGSSGGLSADIVTSWEQTLSDEKVASEKLVKNTLDTKADLNHNHTGTYANSSHNHNIIDLNNVTTVTVTVTYTDDTTENIQLLKYTGS